MQKNTNWEKIGVYCAVLIGFLTCITYVADIKERVAKLEVKVEISEIHARLSTLEERNRGK